METARSRHGEGRRSGGQERRNAAWPSQGALRSFFRRNVGTLFLLRHACAADLLSGSPLALFRRTGISDLRRIYGAGVYSPCCRRLSEIGRAPWREIG